MNKKSFFIKLLVPVCLFFSCNGNQDDFEASGAFEAEETIISSEASGTIMQFNIEEGQELKSGQQIGYIDSIQLHLKKKQIQEQIKAILSRKPDISTQVASLQEQLKTMEKEQIRISNLVNSDAVPKKQLDDINEQIEVMKKQIEAQHSTLGITSESITGETGPLEVQIEQINDLLARCLIVNPVNGTVLAKYVEEKEVSAQGKPLYKIADLSSLFLRAYITGNQLTNVKLNQKVHVLADKGANGYKEYEGTISWISGKAEFTPKTIQTKEERANLVYAVKIKVDNNDGALKIGMYGGVKF